MRVKANFIHKKSVIVAFASASSLFFATSAYALNTSNTKTHSDQTTPEIALSTDVSQLDLATETKDTENNQNPIQTQKETKNQLEPSVQHRSTSDSNPTNVTESSSQVSVNTSGEANVSVVSDEGDVVVVEGSESSNDSRVRIRVRNSSSSELNGEDQDGGGSFSLQIQENVTAD